MLANKIKNLLRTAAPKGRMTPIPTAKVHFIFGHALSTDVPLNMETALFGMGCFWGAERLFWQLPGVYLTMVGYGGGFTPNPTYQEVCTGKTGHNELIRIVFDPVKIPYEVLLSWFWENHDPTQLNQQGNDRGTQYRSGIYTFSSAQSQAANDSQGIFSSRLKAAGFGAIVTEILPAPEFYWAEEYHQQYLAKNPSGYCGIGGVGISCPVGLSI